MQSLRQFFAKIQRVQAGATRRVVVSERRDQLRGAEMLRTVGIEPLRRRLLAVKSAVHFRADLERPKP